MKRFRRILSFFILFVLAFSTFASNSSAQFAPPSSSPNVADWSKSLFNETKFDFQNIPRNASAKHSFKFVNETNDEIRLVSTRSSCGCTKVYVPTKKTYKPGERGEIIAEIDAIRYTGKRRAVVTAVFDGPTRAEIALEVRGFVVDNVRLEPQKLKFIVDETDSDARAKAARNAKNFPNSEKAADAVRVRQTVFTSPSETIARAETTSPFLRLEIGKPTATRSGVQTPLTVSLRENAPAGYFNEIVYLYASGPNGATPFAVAVEGVVRPKFSVAPPTLSFVAGKKDEKIVKNVVVAGTKPFTIKKVECASRAVEIDLSSTRTVRAGNEAAAARPVYVLPVAFDPTRLDAESSTAVLKIETNDGQVLTLETVLSAANFARQTETNDEISR